MTTDHLLRYLGQVLAIVLMAAPCSLTNAAPIQSVQPEAAIKSGLAAITEQEFIKAANIFEQAVLASPNHADLNRYLGIGYYKTGQHEQAIQQLEKTLTLSPDDVEAHYALGLVYLARASEVGVFKVRSMLRNSIKSLEKVIELEPSHTAAHYYLIQILINAPGIVGGDDERGAELNRQLAQLSPLHHQVVNSTLAFQNEDLTTAEALLLESFNTHPDSSLVNFAMLSHYSETGQYDKAIEHGERYLTFPKTWDDTDIAEAHHLLAKAYEQQGNRERSLHHYALTLAHTDNKNTVERVQDEISKMEN